MCFRSLELQPGEPETFTVPNDLRVTNVALGAEMQEGRTSVKLTYRLPKLFDSDDEEDEDEEDEEDKEGEATTTVLCSLTPGKVRSTLIVPTAQHLPEARSSKLSLISS